jgi:uncharacterized protein YndB with AHSA1/START domain
MSEMPTDSRSVVVDRDFPHPPEKVWRALTESGLLAEWLMSNDFSPTVGHRFEFRADWGTVACQVLTVEVRKTLSYSWAAMGLESVVTWTLTPTGGGTHLRMEHVGFRRDQEQAFQGATYGWQMFLAQLDQVVARQG